jgi:hypothetical protein
MDIVKSFIQKNLLTEDNNKELSFKSIKDLFSSEDNINNVSRILYRELYLPNNQTKFNKTKSLVQQYVKLWTDGGYLDKFANTTSDFNDLNEQLRYFNSLFINYYKSKLVNATDFIQHEIDNNPYKQIYEYKLNKKKNDDILADDYNYITFNNYNDKYTVNMQFPRTYNKIPYYEKGLYSRNVDYLDNGSFRERKLINNNFKKYNNQELLNNVDYLR